MAPLVSGACPATPSASAWRQLSAASLLVAGTGCAERDVIGGAEATLSAAAVPDAASAEPAHVGPTMGGLRAMTEEEMMELGYPSRAAGEQLLQPRRPSLQRCCEHSGAQSDARWVSARLQLEAGRVSAHRISTRPWDDALRRCVEASGADLQCKRE